MMKTSPSLAGALGFAGWLVSGRTGQLGTINPLPRLPETITAQFGPALAVCSPVDAAPSTLDLPSGRLGPAGDGAEKGVGAMLRATPFVVTLAPVGAVVGAVIAVTRSVSSDAESNLHADVQRGLAVSAQQHQLRDRVIAVTPARPAPPLLPFSRRTPPGRRGTRGTRSVHQRLRAVGQLSRKRRSALAAHGRLRLQPDFPGNRPGILLRVNPCVPPPPHAARPVTASPPSALPAPNSPTRLRLSL